MNAEMINYIFRHMPEIATERLILRKMRVDDVEDMYDYAKRDELTKYLLWYSHESKKHTKDYLKYITKKYRAGEFFDWAIEEKESGRMIGTCGFTSIDPTHRTGEIGYVINPDFKGRGYAPEAARAIVEFGFYELELNRIEARFMKGNDPSLRVMQKIGMIFEGYLRDYMFVKGEYKTVGVCSILKREFSHSIKLTDN